MNITIKKLTPALAPDYFDFFENRAFTDGSPYRCYCQFYQMSEAQAKAALDNAKGENPGSVSRKIAERQIFSGALQGYLAYAEGLSIGWCNANDMANYPPDACNGARFQLSAEKREANRVKFVVCFEIAPEYRGKGIATALLQRVVEDAAAEGCLAVEGFPENRDVRYEWDCAGPVRLYEKCGFAVVSHGEQFAVMRKDLHRTLSKNTAEQP